MRRVGFIASRPLLIFGLLWAGLALLPGVCAAAENPQQQAAGDFNLLPGFQAEQVYKVPRAEQGSWVSLTVDSQGRLIASSQWGQLYRITPPVRGSGAEAQVEKIDLNIGQAQGLLCAAGSLYVVVNGASAQGSGLYRVRDTDGDDQYDEVQLLRRIQGDGEHGPHGVVLGPDGESLYIVGGNFTKPPDPEKSRVPRHWDEDQILTPQNDSRGFGVSVRVPGGWVCRTDLDGKVWELIATGFRNPYDLALSDQGDLFTYDSDNERDIGTPWYRPTRICHVVSGGEFGWRTGTGKWPAYQPDSLPPAVEIGTGSPTGITFGYGTQFPEKYQRALFVSDWSFGNLYAVHLAPQGASYEGTFEPFVTAAPLPVTDCVVRPQDGMLYFTVGGRGVESALYRIWYPGDGGQKIDGPKPAAPPLGELRRRLEARHQPGSEAGDAEQIVTEVWPYLAHPDRHICFAARIALEHQPVALWQERVLAATNPRALIHGVIGLSRSRGKHDAGLQKKIIAALGRLDWSQLNVEDRSASLRAYQLALIRLGPLTETLRETIIKRLEPLYPATTEPLNRELCGLLILLRASQVVPKTLELLRRAQTQEEQIHYMLCLRLLQQGWTLPERRAYFNWFRRAPQYGGDQSFEGFTGAIRKEAIANLLPEEKRALGELLVENLAESLLPATKRRNLVRNWTVDKLWDAVSTATSGHDFARGEELFSATGCFKCHRMAGRGGVVGPDLTGVGRRFTTRDLLEAVVEPSRVISDQYRSTIFTLTDGKTISGHIADMGQNELSVMTDMLLPGDYTKIDRGAIEAMQPSLVSMMPAGLLNTRTLKEILDLMAYLRSGADPEHPLFIAPHAAP